MLWELILQHDVASARTDSGCGREIPILIPNKQQCHCEAVIFRVQSSRWTRNFIVLRVDLWRFFALSLDCTAQTAFAMTFRRLELGR